MSFLAYNGKILTRSSKWIDYSNAGPTPVPTFVQQIPYSTSTDIVEDWPTFYGDAPTSVDLSFSAKRIGVVIVEFYTVDTSTGTETLYGYYDNFTAKGSSNVQLSVEAASGYYLYQLDVSPISSDLQSGAKTMKLFIYTRNGVVATLTYDNTACGYWT